MKTVLTLLILLTCVIPVYGREGEGLLAENLNGGNLREADLEGANLSGIDLRGADLTKAICAELI